MARVKVDGVEIEEPQESARAPGVRVRGQGNSGLLLSRAARHRRQAARRGAGGAPIRYGLASLALLGTVALACPAAAQDAREALVQCAWSRVAATSATLVGRVRFDRQYVYDADGSPTVGLIMRIRAACHDEHLAFARNWGDRSGLRDFLRRLRAARARTASPDAFQDRVFRCESRFADAPSAPPAAVSWGYGGDLAQHQLFQTSTIYGHSQAISSGDLDNPAAISRVLNEAERTSSEAVETETMAQGRATGRPYRLKDGGGSRSCRIVHSDGSYTDA